MFRRYKVRVVFQRTFTSRAFLSIWDWAAGTGFVSERQRGNFIRLFPPNFGQIKYPLRPEAMMRFCCFCVLVLTGCYRGSTVSELPNPSPTASTWFRVYQTADTMAVEITVADKTTREPIPFTMIKIMGPDSNITYKGNTDLDGYWKIRPVPRELSSMHLSFPGYTPLLITHINFRPGDSVAVFLEPKPIQPEERYRFRYPPREEFAPLNRTFSREEIRRMPK